LKSQQCSDYKLVQKFLSGDDSGIEQLINRHKDKVFNYIFMLVKKEALAEDLFQDTFYKVINSLKNGKYHDNGKFLSWVLRIAHNLVIDHFRKAKQLNTLSNDDYESDIFNTKKIAEKTIEENIVDKQMHRDVRKLINMLPDDQREVVVLRHYVGMSFKEIAAFTEVSINTALGRMRYALLNMRKMAEEKSLNLAL
jgi:RNA polymerase sigma-70 factor (ECF subfamily)